MAVNVTLNMAGVRQVLSSPGVQAELDRLAEDVAKRATERAHDEGFKHAEFTAKLDTHDRSHDIATAHVWANKAARIANDKKQILETILWEM